MKRTEFLDRQKLKQVTNLDTPLLRFNIGNKEDPRNYWRLRDAVKGVQIFGGIGSGKTSGSGRLLALTYLKSGFGGLVLTGKIDEVETWKDYAKLTGREDDLIIFEKDSPYSFNFLQYELERQSKGNEETLIIARQFMEIYDMGRNFMSSGGGGGGSNEAFWDNAQNRFTTKAIDLLKMSEQEVSIANLRKVLVNALNKEEADTYRKLRYSAFDQSNSPEERQNALGNLERSVGQNYCLNNLTKGYNRPNKTELQDETIQFLSEYFLTLYPKIPDKTRAIIEESFLGLVEPFMSGILRKHFTRGISPELLPEETYKNGKIIIINFPVKEYLVAGVYAQAIYKKIWQEAIERRDPAIHPLPVFMWIDEAQYFLNKHDARFQTTARSSRACTVLISQNISNYYAAIGGKYPKDNVNSLLGNLGTKIFHANNDHVTNSWASDTIGKTFRAQQSTQSNLEQLNGSTTISEALNYQIEPQQFTTLRSGGEENRLKVEGIMTVSGKEWSNGRNFIRVMFDQLYTP